jgi:hypothetical protein
MRVGELGASLTMVMVALDEIVPCGVKTAPKLAAPVGEIRRGKDGSPFSVKNGPTTVIEVIVKGLLPELEIVSVWEDEFEMGTSPKTTGFGDTAMPMEEDVTVKPFASDSISLPVFTVTVRSPTGAVGSMLREAVAFVEELTTREFTVMPAPKLTPEVPWTKWVNCPAIATERFCCPCRALAGETPDKAGFWAVTVNALAKETTSEPVVRVTVLGPGAAE